MHYGCWQFIIQTKPEQPDEEATYKEKLDLQTSSRRRYLSATAAAHGDPNGKNDYQKKEVILPPRVILCNDKSLFLDLKPITNMKMSLATEDKSCPVEGIGNNLDFG
ncbi:hypothetical protein TNCV_971131 [Trichonephila clavipes]|nr:hypothetical protein TNCV_971131 [Trichonephila clavipes]